MSIAFLASGLSDGSHREAVGRASAAPAGTAYAGAATACAAHRRWTSGGTYESERCLRQQRDAGDGPVHALVEWRALRIGAIEQETGVCTRQLGLGQRLEAIAGRSRLQ